jgi:hypothetical protein
MIFFVIGLFLLSWIVDGSACQFHRFRRFFYMQAHTADRVRRAESCSFRRMHSSVLLYVLCLAFCMKRLHVSGRLMPALRPVCVSEHLLSCLRTSTCSVFTSCLVQSSIVLYEDR